MATKVAQRRLYRSRDAYIGGVCAGIAEYYGLDALVVRILAIMLFIMTLGLDTIVYLVLWAHLPLEPEEAKPLEIEPESAELAHYGAVEYYMMENEKGEEELMRLPLRGLSVVGRLGVMIVMVALFLGLTAVLLPVFPGTQWWQFWPVFTLILGLFFIMVPIRSTYHTAWVGAGIGVAAISAMILPMSLHVVAWDTLAYAFEMLWPLLAVSIVLYVWGFVRSIDALVLGGSFCFVLFCLVGFVLCVLPGEFQAFMLPFVFDGFEQIPSV